MKPVTRLVSTGKETGLGVLGLESRLLGKATLALTVPLGSTFYTDINTENTTGGTVYKDFLAGFGTYDPSSGTFTMVWGHVEEDLSIPTGSVWNTIPCVANAVGDWDAIGAIGTYDPDTHLFTIESAMVLEDALTVTGAVVVTGLVLHT